MRVTVHESSVLENFEGVRFVYCSLDVGLFGKQNTPWNGLFT